VRGAAVRAAGTITFVRLKPGHLLQPGRALCGPVELADIGIGEEIVRALGVSAFANGPELWGAAFPRLAVDAHKYTRGHAVVLSGGRLHTGAARLAARGALRAGAGLVTLASPEEALAVNAAHLTAIMLRPCDGPEDLEDLLADPRLNAVALGPALGIGEGTRALVSAALDAERAVVLDADAITSHAGDPEALARPGRHAGPGEGAWPVVTPHDGELARLLRGRDDILEHPSKIERARAAAALTQAVMVLKGPDTVIAAPDGRAAVNRNGSAVLGTAGSGDVLAGVIAGLLAQGMPSFEAACAGVWLHAEAGARFGPGLVAEDIPEGLPGVLRELMG
jgi:NAD(P)H-hydrate epimerase